MPWQPMHMEFFCFAASALPSTAQTGMARLAAAMSDRIDRPCMLSPDCWGNAGMPRRFYASPAAGAKHLFSFHLPSGGFPMRFSGTDQYVATDDLMLAVNAAITLQRPLRSEERRVGKECRSRWSP